MGHLAPGRARHESRLPVPAKHVARRARRLGLVRRLQQARGPGEDGQHRTDRERAAGDDHDAVLLPIALDAGTYVNGERTMPAVSGTASRDTNGRIHVTLTNVDPNQPRTINVSVRGQAVTGVSGRVLTADRMNAHNTFEQPEAVRPAPFTGATVAGERLTVQLPAKSLVVLELR